MNHEDTIREMSVERYLLGELAGDSRLRFEEHLFECPRCAFDLKSGVTLLEGARVELTAPSRSAVPVRPRPARRLQWLLSPAWMVPALAASIALVLYQSLFLVPGMRKQMAQTTSPAILTSLVFTGGAARGAGTPKIAVPAHGSFLLAVDIPSAPDYASYLCSLSSPSGVVVWHGAVSAEQAKDTVEIQVPAGVAKPGENILLVEGVRQGDGRDGPGAKMDILAQHRFTVEIIQ